MLTKLDNESLKTQKVINSDFFNILQNVPHLFSKIFFQACVNLNLEKRSGIKQWCVSSLDLFHIHSNIIRRELEILSGFINRIRLTALNLQKLMEKEIEERDWKRRGTHCTTKVCSAVKQRGQSQMRVTKWLFRNHASNQI